MSDAARADYAYSEFVCHFLLPPKRESFLSEK